MFGFLLTGEGYFFRSVYIRWVLHTEQAKSSSLHILDFAMRGQRFSSSCLNTYANDTSYDRTKIPDFLPNQPTILYIDYYIWLEAPYSGQFNAEFGGVQIEEVCGTADPIPHSEDCAA